MRIAYLVNQYPKISHAFIRREILGVESQGCDVTRYSLRQTHEDLPDPLDKVEAAKTKVVLDAGPVGLLLAVVRLALRRPMMFLRAVSLGARVGLRSERGLLRHAIYLAEACVLVHWFARDRIEHVHAHFGTNSTTVAMLCHALGGPHYSFTAHGPEEFDKAPLLGLGHKIERASFVAAISSFGRSQLFRRCRIPHWPKIDIVRCGVDESFLGPAPAPLPTQRRLVSIGRLCEQKGQILLIEAMSRLRQRGRMAEIVLIGDGVLRPEIEAAIVRHGLETQVRILGWADSATIRRTLDESCALVLPSFAEGLPVVIMEAMARARPILSTYVAGIPELVVPGRNGWLVPAGSVEALVEGLCKVLDTPLEELTQMGMYGREDVRSQHEIGMLARKMAAKFREVIESGHSGTASTS
jgi:colanic acid/amylovoran biosynthesis glycosyltransferase